jgi:hypothetical protein
MRNKMDDLIEKSKFKILTMNWQTVFNPFSKFSEKQLFILVSYFIFDVLVCFILQLEWIVFFIFSTRKPNTLRGIHFEYQYGFGYSISLLVAL